MQIVKYNGYDCKVIRQGKNMYLSAYGDELPTPEDVALQTSRLSIAFPKQSKEFIALLVERMLDNKFTARRMRDAINYLIDNFQYKELNVSDVLKYDRRKTLITYDKMLTTLSCNGGCYKDSDVYSRIEVDGVRMYFLKNE